MRRFDFLGGIWCRVGRYWYGLIYSWPLVYRVPVIAGGSEGLTAQGTYIVMGDGASPEGFDEIAEVTSIGAGPTISREDIDFTHLRSPEGFREFKNGFKDGGEIPLRIQYNPTAHPTHDATTGIAAKLDLEDPTNWKIVFPNATSWDFAATVRQFGLEPIEVGGKIEVGVVLKVSGAVDFTGTGSPS